LLEFLKAKVDLRGYAFLSKHLYDQVQISNLEHYSVEIIPDTVALLENVCVTLSSTMKKGSTHNDTSGSYILQSGDVRTMKIGFDPAERTAGQDTSSILF
jgi:hypothetical protein